MRSQQPDGFPLTFNLPDAAAMTGARVSALRTNIARKVLRHVGQPPFAGTERRFTVTGLVEAAIIDALSETLPLDDASRVADHGLRTAFATAVLSGDLPKEAALAHDDIFDSNPQYWMKGRQWEHRDLSDPVFWVFALLTKKLFFDVALGWSDIKRASEEVAKQTYEALIASAPAGAAATETSKECVEAIVEHVQLLNLTAILTKIDRAIEQKLSQVEA